MSGPPRWSPRRARARSSSSSPKSNSPWLGTRRGHRAIGVVYPTAERRGNWVPTVMGRRYDAFCHFHHTDALHPLHLEGAYGRQRVGTSSNVDHHPRR